MKRRCFTLLLLLLCMSFLASDSFLLPGILWLRIGDSYKTQQSAINTYADRSLFTFTGYRPCAAFGDYNYFYYRENTIVYVGANSNVRGYAVFTLDGELLVYDHTDLLFDENSHIRYDLEEYGRIMPQSYIAFQLVDSSILEADFPMSFQEMYDRFGPLYPGAAAHIRGLTTIYWTMAATCDCTRYRRILPVCTMNLMTPTI